MEAEPVGQKPSRRRRGKASAGACASHSPPANGTPGVTASAASCNRCHITILGHLLRSSQETKSTAWTLVLPRERSTEPAQAFNSRYLLRRGSSFMFLTPGPQWDFTLKRKRGAKDDDVVSLCSLDFKIIVPHTMKMVCKMAGAITPVQMDYNAAAILVYFGLLTSPSLPRVLRKNKPDLLDESNCIPGECSHASCCDRRQKFSSQEPSNKRVRPLARVTSLASLISPVRNGAVRRFGQTIQSFALRSDSKSPASAQKSCSRSAAPTPPKRRNSVLWSEMLDVNMKESLSTKEIKRQEAIYEMSRGEQDLIEDLKLARKAYHDPMLKLSIMSEEELTHIFGDLDSYIPLHEDLLASLGEATKPDGTVEQIGPILVKWLPRLHAYKGYCSNQLAAKALLDQKKQDRRVQDFLQRCLESPFSRKLDLWSFLDIPRSRLVKYPLLLKEILRHTPKDHPDTQILEEAISIIQGVLSDINLKKGESECQYYIDKLEYLDEKQRDPRIEGSKALLCHGELKNKNGHKLYVFLFQDILVLTRPVTRNERQAYQVYRQPIPVQELLLEDLQDGDVKMGGSFRGAFGNSDKAKNIFRVRFQDPSPGQSHTLQANDVFHKQQWVNCIRTAIAPFQRTAAAAELKELPELSEESEENNPSAPNIRAQKRQSGITEMELDESTSECGSVLDSEEAKGVETHRTLSGHSKTREKRLSSKQKETLV